MNAPAFHTRRSFIRQAACAALGTAGLSSTVWDLRRMSAASANAGGDYKALVCLFLYGGNDGNNLLVPTDAVSYRAYAASRQQLALPQASLLPIYPRNGDGRTYGLHPSTVGLQGLFAQGRLALVANVGTLVAPITRADFLRGGAAVPPQLFSHTDQQVQWQTSVPDQMALTGWGGRSADLVMSLNANPNLSMAISLAGTNTFQIGKHVVPYGIAPGDVSGLKGYYGRPSDNARYAAVQSILGLNAQNSYEREFANMTKLAIGDNNFLQTALAGAPALRTIFPETALGNQMNMVAQMISVRAALGVRRQIFFCAVGGYDTHGDQLEDQATLLSELSRSMRAFDAAMVELGVHPSVTTFTASDFGRTFPANDEGSDHGWGNHHLVMGGAVAGGRLYGKFPTLAVDGPDDTGMGRWIPTTSVDEYSATLARWFGVSANDLPLVLPNIGRFAQPNLGFMVV